MTSSSRDDVGGERPEAADQRRRPRWQEPTPGRGDARGIVDRRDGAGDRTPAIASARDGVERPEHRLPEPGADIDGIGGAEQRGREPPLDEREGPPGGAVAGLHDVGHLVEHHPDLVPPPTPPGQPPPESEIHPFVSERIRRVLQEEATRRRESVDRPADPAEVGGGPAAGLAMERHSRALALVGPPPRPERRGPDVDVGPARRQAARDQARVIGHPAELRGVLAGEDLPAAGAGFAGHRGS